MSKQNTFTIHADSGINITAKAKTLIGAKREASNWISHGGGSVYVDQNGKTVAMRKFWSSGRHFGWDKWTSV